MFKAVFSPSSSPFTVTAFVVRQRPAVADTSAVCVENYELPGRRTVVEVVHKQPLSYNKVLFVLSYVKSLLSVPLLHKKTIKSHVKASLLS